MKYFLLLLFLEFHLLKKTQKKQGLWIWKPFPASYKHITRIFWACSLYCCKHIWVWAEILPCLLKKHLVGRRRVVPSIFPWKGDKSCLRKESLQAKFLLVLIVQWKPIFKGNPKFTEPASENCPVVVVQSNQLAHKKILRTFARWISLEISDI